MADLKSPMNTMNRTVLINAGEIHSSCGVADSWHCVIEKTFTLQNGMTGHTARINVEVKSLSNLISHYDKPFK